MSHTIPRPLDRPVGADPSSGDGDIGARLAGVGAITFATTVVIQNVIRAATAPGTGEVPS